MSKQLIEIEVPDGMKAIWKNGKIEFISINPFEKIKTVIDAVKYLEQHDLCPRLIEEYVNTSVGSYSRRMCEYRIVVAALTNNEERHLTTGERWYPVVQFCRPKDKENCYGNTVVGTIESEGERYLVVGGHADDGASAGLGYFYSACGVSSSWADVGFRSVSSKEAAEHISKYFGRLLFDVHYGGTNCDWKWVD